MNKQEFDDATHEFEIVDAKDLGLDPLAPLGKRGPKTRHYRRTMATFARLPKDKAMLVPAAGGRPLQHQQASWAGRLFRVFEKTKARHVRMDPEGRGVWLRGHDLDDVCDWCRPSQ